MKRKSKFSRLWHGAAAAALSASMLVSMMPAVYADGTTSGSGTIEEDKSDIVFPVTFYDFDMDNIFFEYEDGTGLDLVTGDSTETGLNGIQVGTNLVEARLADDGTPIFTDEAYQLAAEKMLANLALNDPASDEKGRYQSEIFAALKDELVGEKWSEKDTLTEAYNKGWRIPENTAADSGYGILGTTAYYGEIGEDPALLWEDNGGNGMTGYRADAPMTSVSVAVDPDTDYTLGYYMGGDGGKIEILDENGILLCSFTEAGDKIQNFNTGDHQSIQIKLTPSESGVRFDNVILTKVISVSTPDSTENGTTKDESTETGTPDSAADGNTEDESTETGTPDSATSGNTENESTETGTPEANADASQNTSDTLTEVKLLKGNDVSKADKWSLAYTGDINYIDGVGYVKDFTPHWKQDGDGIISMTDNAEIEKTFTISNPGNVHLKFWCGDGSEQIKITITPYTNGVSGEEISVTYSGTGGFINTDAAKIPADSDSIKVKITVPKKSRKISALDITSFADANLGTLEETKNKTIDLSKGIEDIDTCMDYVYTVMNSFFSGSAVTGEVPTSIVLTYEDKENSAFVNTLNKYVQDGKLSKSAVDNIENIHTFAANFDSEKNVEVKDGQLINSSAETKNTHYGLFPLDDILDGSALENIVASGDSPKKIDTESGEWTRGQFSKNNTTEYQYHNYHYSMVSKSNFKYIEGANQFFYFDGDDDVYLFINDQLAMNLGGAHLAADGILFLDEEAANLGLEDGKYYDFSFFYMERRTDYSNFEVATNINFIQKEAPKTYDVRHKFISVTEGRELPEEVLVLLPEDVTGKENGYEASVATPAQTRVSVSDGTWVFVEWDHTSETINDKDVVFVGSWKFVKNSSGGSSTTKTYKAEYEFKSEDGSELPKEVTDLLPKDNNRYTNGTKVDAKTLETTEVKVDGGKWVFDAWDEDTKTIAGSDIKFVGTWKFVKESETTEDPENPDKDDPEKPGNDDPTKPTDDSKTPDNTNNGGKNNGGNSNSESNGGKTISGNGSKSNTAITANAVTSGNAGVVKTGDTSQAAVYAVVLVLAAAAATVLLIMRKRRAGMLD